MKAQLTLFGSFDLTHDLTYLWGTVGINAVTPKHSIVTHLIYYIAHVSLLFVPFTVITTCISPHVGLHMSARTDC